MDALLSYPNSAETCLAAADMCELLAVAFEPPTEELARGLSDGAFSADLVACLDEMGIPADKVGEVGSALAYVEGEDSEVLYTAMKQEYSHLFAHPKRPLVWRYETMFKEEAGQSKEPPSLFISPTCLHVEQLMKKAGVSVAAANKQPADFVANELHFASYLLTRCAMEAAEESDVSQGLETESAKADSLLTPVREPNKTEAYEVYVDLYEHHLALWLAGFMKQVAEKTELGVYRAVAQAGLLTLGA